MMALLKSDLESSLVVQAELLEGALATTRFFNLAVELLKTLRKHAISRLHRFFLLQVEIRFSHRSTVVEHGHRQILLFLFWLDLRRARLRNLFPVLLVGEEGA